MSIMDLVEKRKQARIKEERTKVAKNVAVGAALGAAVGVAAGVLLAPKSGKETREDIANAAKELPDKAKKIVEKTREKVEEVKSKLKDKQIQDVENQEI